MLGESYGIITEPLGIKKQNINSGKKGRGKDIFNKNLMERLCYIVRS
jgi:hypothetical protein